MIKFLSAVALSIFAITATAKEITGAGATFPYPVYAKLAEEYAKQSGVKLNYWKLWD